MILLPKPLTDHEGHLTEAALTLSEGFLILFLPGHVLKSA